MSREKISFTPDQQKAIENDGGSLLVSAAAGSGKTKVLVERLLRKITDLNKKVNIDNFLVITYTKAAAAELRGKIIDEISKRLAEEPENRHLKKQLNLCYRAGIGTIHSFCTAILRENAQYLGISPDFRVADENESGILKQSALDKVLEKRYETEKNGSGFFALVDTMSAGRDDRKLMEIVLDTHSKLQCHPYLQRWIEKEKKLFSDCHSLDAAETPWGKILINKARRTAIYWVGKIKELLAEGETHPDFLKAYGDSLGETLCGLESFNAALDKGWNEARAKAAIPFPRAKNLSGYEETKNVRKKCQAEMKKTAAIFENSSGELMEDMQAVKPRIDALFDLVTDFDREYAAEKLKRGLLDFSDLEHFAAKLLVQPDTMKPTDIAVGISQRFEEIMVDEYQDVNAVQELIFGAVSKNGQNLFMVGDVKQSIYRFRLADPTIFLEKYRKFKSADEAAEGEERKVILSKNFRSRAGVLEAANYVFKNVMSVEFGEMDYTPAEYLYAGAEYPENDESAVELCVIDMDGYESDDGEEAPQKTEYEAAFAAKRIAELIKNGRVSDGKGGMRRVKYGDIAILMRSVKNKSAQYSAALQSCGIPTSIEKSSGFFETVEISVIVSLLSVIDNPHQDIPLISAMRSPIYGFTADELAEIRVVDKEGDFYSALKKTAETNEKCRRFLDELFEYRSIAPDMPTDKLIWHIYNKTGMLGIMGAMPSGDIRYNNLMRFFKCAGDYEKAGYKGLFQFITYIRKMMENGEELPGEATGGETDAVKIMSIHKSKGLEYPIVFLADTAKKFNRADSMKPLLIHPELGVGAKRLDLDRKIEYPTISRMAVAEKINSEMMAEELRVLYVALTRAKEKLIMLCTYANGEKELKKLAKDADAPVQPQVLANTKSMADWILLTALKRQESTVLHFGEGFVPCDCGDSRWSIRFIRGETEKTEAFEERGPEEKKESGEAESVSALKRKMEFEYPYKIAVNMPTKLTATEIKGHFFDAEAAEEAESISWRKAEADMAKPGFITGEKGITAAEKGTIMHTVMQYIDMKSCSSRKEIEDELCRLKERGIITDEQAKYVSPERIYKFFTTNIGQRVLKADRVEREFKFLLLVPSNDLVPNTGDEEILLQGVIDCFICEGDEITIIDYKTDYINDGNIEEKTELYRNQLEIYAKAITKITGKKVKDMVIYFFSSNMEVNL